MPVQLCTVNAVGSCNSEKRTHLNKTSASRPSGGIQVKLIIVFSEGSLWVIPWPASW